MRMFGKSSCRHSSCERGLLLSIFDFKRKKYRTFLQDSETGEEIAEEYEKGRGVWKKHDVQDGKGSEMRENLIRKHYWFSGRVQGVGFRYRACYIASSLGVTGWVRNNWDDRVEMEAQCKLVRAVRGTVFDVAVDLRSNSETYGKWYGVTLSAENKKQFLIPEGFAHGFLVLSDEAEFCYKVNDFWHPNDEGGMAWNDPEIGIEWPELKGEYKGSASAEGYTLKDGTALNLSDKDQKWLGLKDTFKF